MLDTLSEGYLGQSTEQKDDIFKGVSFELGLHTGDPGVFDLIELIKARAQRREATSRIGITARFTFPDGRVRKGVIGDAFFGAIPVEIGARDEFVKFTLKGEASDIRFI